MDRILVADRVAEDGVALLKEHADVDVRVGMSPAELIAAIPAYDGLVVRSATKVTAEVIEAAHNLKVIGRAGVGVDNIDVEAATMHGIVVANAPEAITVATAEHAIGLMLAVARNIPTAHDSLQQGRWEPSKFVGVELRGKTLGLFGLGRIGSEVARRARALEMRVIAHDPPLPAERFEMLGVEIATKDEVLEQSDFISLHAPGMASNYHMIDDAEFAKMKPGVRIINAARGELMSQEALLKAIESGKVAGAALDSYEPEPPALDTPLLHHPKIIVTPHLGASAAEAQERVAMDVAKQVLAVLRGEPAMYAVNSPFIAAETFKVLAPYLQASTQAASLATQLATGQMKTVEIEYLGELADYDVTPLKASVIRGLLAPVTEENVTLVNANMIAEQRGLRISERKGFYEGIYSSLIRVTVTTSTGKTTVSSTVAHDGPHIVEINDFWVDASPGEGYLLLCENEDTPGMIGKIGTFLGEKDVNISFMRVGREKVRGRALMVLGLDDEITPALLEQISRIPSIFSARTARV
jgi:D-3-phosphoglycerate dehydrogenase